MFYFHTPISADILEFSWMLAEHSWVNNNPKQKYHFLLPIQIKPFTDKLYNYINIDVNYSVKIKIFFYRILEQFITVYTDQKILCMIVLQWIECLDGNFCWKNTTSTDNYTADELRRQSIINPDATDNNTTREFYMKALVSINFTGNRSH